MKSPLYLTTSRFHSKSPLFQKSRTKETTISKQTHKPTISSYSTKKHIDSYQAKTTFNSFHTAKPKTTYFSLSKNQLHNKPLNTTITSLNNRSQNIRQVFHKATPTNPNSEFNSRSISPLSSSIQSTYIHVKPINKYINNENSFNRQFTKYGLLRLKVKTPDKCDRSVNMIEHCLVRLSNKVRFSQIHNLHTISRDSSKDNKNEIAKYRSAGNSIQKKKRNYNSEQKEVNYKGIFKQNSVANKRIVINNCKSKSSNNSFCKHRKVNDNKSIKVNQRKLSKKQHKPVMLNKSTAPLLKETLPDTAHSSLNSITFSKLINQTTNTPITLDTDNELFSVPSRNNLLQLPQKTLYSSIKFLHSNLPSTNTSHHQHISKQIHYISTSTHKGKSPFPNEKHSNQDTFFISNFKEINYTFIGVCDGHGVNGHLISKYIQEHLPKIVYSNLTSKLHNKPFSKHSSIIHKYIENSFILLNSKLSNDANIDSNFSGSTCVSLLMNNESLYSANVGDSRAIKGRYVTKESKWKYDTLTRDHKATEQDEIKRIERFGGRISPFQEQNGTYAGPNRVWLKDKPFPGLAMTRSIGDQIACSVGVVCEPEIKEFTYKEEDMFIVIASDGLWEYVSNEEVVNIVGNSLMCGNYKQTADELYKYAVTKWEEHEESIDDITIIVIFLN